MATGDQFGALTFPLSAVTTGETAGDPALGLLLSFLQTAVNADCGTMWDSVCPDRNPIGFCFAHDPNKLFEEDRLPALYAWRGKSTRSRVADDLYKRTTRLQLAWVNEPGSEDTLMTRDPAMNAISGAIDNALTGDRHPSWVVTGDTDPVAPIRGSSFSSLCSFSRCQPSSDGPQELLFQRVDGTQPLAYYGFSLEVEIDEYQDKATGGVYQSKLNATTTTNDGLVTKPVEDVPDVPEGD